MLQNQRMNSDARDIWLACFKILVEINAASGSAEGTFFSEIQS